MIEGSCLCGGVRWQFAGDPDGATACNCTACRRYGVLWAIDHFDGLDTFTDLPRDGRCVADYRF